VNRERDSAESGPTPQGARFETSTVSAVRTSSAMSSDIVAPGNGQGFGLVVVTPWSSWPWAHPVALDGCAAELEQRRSRLRDTGYSRQQSARNDCRPKDLEGELSPREDRASNRRQRRLDVTDSPAEQRLEVAATAMNASTFDPGNGIESKRKRHGTQNDKKATATVTWCGCERGESFEGSERRFRGTCWLVHDIAYAVIVAAECRKRSEP